MKITPGIEAPSMRSCAKRRQSWSAVTTGRPISPPRSLVDCRAALPRDRLLVRGGTISWSASGARESDHLRFPDLARGARPIPAP
jgi:hypothetical protein